MWAGADQTRIADILADVLAQMLLPEFVYVRLFDRHEGPDTEAFRLVAGDGATLKHAIRGSADAWFRHETRLGSHSLTCSIDGRGLSVIALDLGTRGEFGFVFVGSGRPEFPTSAERLLVSVAASQALIAVQQHWLLQEQKDVATRLDGLVAQRSEELETASEALRRSESIMAHAESASLTGSFRWHPVTDTLEWSAQAHRLFGFEADRLITSDDFFDRVDPDDHGQLREAGAKASLDPIDLDLTFTVMPPGQEPRVLRLVAHPGTHVTEQGAYIGTMQDITERVRAESASRVAEARMRELRDELSHANRLATLGQFSAAISHDVRQPLSSVSANAMAGLNWLNASAPNLDSARRALERIVTGVKRAADILDRVKSFSRRNSPCISVDLNDLVSDTVALVDADARRRRILLSTDLAGDLPALQADRVQIQQVLMNLIVNALDAFDESSLDARKVNVPTWLDAEEIGVEVRDTGPGLSAMAIPRLFEAFNTTKAAGLGMGLSICRDIVADHHGRIWTDANEPSGAVFGFSFPTTERVE
ncbi:His Kinase A (phospho-acceptor) domain-containing protein [Sphingomonas sp. NFR15]|nr:His Kinase A (phospho-acceptor) domain-containing protein [Sphingomonas sp. NFR15]